MATQYPWPRMPRQFVSAVHAGDVDAHQPLVARERLEIFPRELVQTWAPQTRGAGQQAGQLEGGVVFRHVDLRAHGDVRQRRQVRTGEGLEVDVGGHEDRVADAIAPLQRLVVVLGVAIAQSHQRLGEQRRAAAERDQVEASGLAALSDQRHQPLDVGDEGAGARAVDEVVPHPGPGGPAEGHHRRRATQVVGPAAHERHHLVEGDAVPRHVDHRLAGARGPDLAVDGGDEGPVGVAPHLAELLDRRDAGRAQRVDAAGAVRLHEVGKGPARLAQLHVGQAEAHRVACTLAGSAREPPPGAGARVVAYRTRTSVSRSSGATRRVKSKRASFMMTGAGIMVQVRVVAAAAGQQTDEGEDGQDGGAAHAASVATRVLTAW